MTTDVSATVTNWKGSIVSHPARVVRPTTVDEIVNVLSDPATYPSPVRAVGSNHSTTRCAVAERGTVIDMTGMDRIIEITGDSVTVQAGALYIDVAKALEQRGLQFYVNVELGPYFCPNRRAFYSITQIGGNSNHVSRTDQGQKR